MTASRAYEFQREKIDPTAFIAANATVLGDVGNRRRVEYLVRGDRAGGYRVDPHWQTDQC